MKKFIVSENIVHATSRSFKESIDFAVELTERNHNFKTSAHDVKFVGTVVTFNPSNKEVECFSHYDYIDYSNDSAVEKSLQKKLSSIVSNEEFASNEFVTFVRASDFEYHGYVGYSSKEERQLDNMKLEHKAMSIYIEIINSNEFSKTSEGTSIDTLELSVRTVNCLKRAGIDSIEQVKSLSLDKVLRIRNLGRNSFDELERVLGITFV